MKLRKKTQRIVLASTRYYLDVDSTFFERHGRPNSLQNNVVSLLGGVYSSGILSITFYLGRKIFYNVLFSREIKKRTDEPTF